MMSDSKKDCFAHGGVLLFLFALQFFLPAYHHGNMARIMVLASYAIGYNLLFGYTGLLSLGHAIFFAAGLYGSGLAISQFGFSVGVALVIGVAAGCVLSAVIGALALRTEGVAFMIVTLMFAQAGYLTVLYFGEYTRGDEGVVLAHADRVLWGVSLSDQTSRYFSAFSLFCVSLIMCLALVRSRFGKVLIAIRENEERTQMLGYNVVWYKFCTIILSGSISALAGATYALLFGYVGASFASAEYSIYPLLWVLLGGAGTVIGPLVGMIFMFYLIDLSSGVTTAYMLVAGLVLVFLAVFAPQGVMGEVRSRMWKWLS